MVEDGQLTGRVWAQVLAFPAWRRQEEAVHPRTKYRMAFYAGRRGQRQEHDGLGEALSL